MRMRIAVSAALLLGLILGSGLALAREPGTSDKVSSQELFIRELAGDPSKEVVSQLYTFKARCRYALAYPPRHPRGRLCHQGHVHLRPRGRGAEVNARG
jgi:hypothetical protein